jgi:hypothetical protein
MPIFPLSWRRSLALAAVLALALGWSTAAELDPAPAGTFTVVVIPDSQGYHGRATKLEPESRDPLTNPVFANHIRWLRESVVSQRIVFVTHVGDIVDRDNADQWRLAQENMDGLRGVVPFGIAVGNHDMSNRGDASLFSAHFPAASFKAYPWYGGTFEPQSPEQNLYGDNVNSYQLFSAEGLDCVIIHLECNAPDIVIAWADAILTKYANRRAMISTHMDLGIREKPTTGEGFISDPKGRMEWLKIHGKLGNTPAQLWDKLYRRHANLGFIFSGDQSRVTALRISAPGDHGNVVHAVMSDYMSAGPLRLYRFIPRENKVRVITFDTTKRQLVDRMPYVPDYTQHQFTLDYPMARNPVP